MSETIFKKPVINCMVEGCKNESDPGSTQCLCRMCYDVITTGNTDKYYADHKGKTWISGIIKWNNYLRESDNLSYELENIVKKLSSEVNALKLEIKEAYILEDNTTLSLNDLRTFYHENKNLIANAKENETVRTALEKKTSFQTVRLYERYEQIVALAHEKSALTKENEALKKEIGALKEDVNYKKQVIDSIEEIARNRENRENQALIHENQALVKENKALKERVEFLEKERDALVHNMDHAYNLGNGKFMTLDDLHNFYTDNKNVHNKLERQRHHITLLELQLKQLRKPKDEDFAAKAKEHSDKKAEAAEQNMKFEAYTSGFWKGFDLGYSKARDQYYE